MAIRWNKDRCYEKAFLKFSNLELPHENSWLPESYIHCILHPPMHQCIYINIIYLKNTKLIRTHSNWNSKNKEEARMPMDVLEMARSSTRTSALCLEHPPTHTLVGSGQPPRARSLGQHCLRWWLLPYLHHPTSYYWVKCWRMEGEWAP
jgi:hypothetical protein